MTIVINYTNKSGAMPETLTDVKSYRDTSIWSIEVVFNNGKIESFHSVESVKELSEPEVMTNISEDDFRELLAVMEYEALAIKDPIQYELASEEEQVEKWVDAMDKQDLQAEANKLGYRVI